MDGRRAARGASTSSNGSGWSTAAARRPSSAAPANRPYPPDKAVLVGNAKRKHVPRHLAAARKVVKRLAEDPKAACFVRPVDEVADGAPGYRQIVERPMDLGSILVYIEAELYSSQDEVHADVQQVWHNCKLYNGTALWGRVGYAVMLCAILLQEEFNEEWAREVLKQPPTSRDELQEGRRRLQHCLCFMNPADIHRVLCLITLGSPAALDAQRLATAGVRCAIDPVKLSPATLQACVRFANSATPTPVPGVQPAILAWPRDNRTEQPYEEEAYL